MTTTDTFIINDIDVSECEYRHDDKCNCRGFAFEDENGNEIKALTLHLNCKDNPSCYYKQLKKEHKEKHKFIDKYFMYKFMAERIKKDLEESTECESQECGCDDYEQCLKCTINRILKEINEVQNADITP